jgi:hypothetical protein
MTQSVFTIAILIHDRNPRTFADRPSVPRRVRSGKWRQPCRHRRRACHVSNDRQVRDEQQVEDNYAGKNRGPIQPVNIISVTICSSYSNLMTKRDR